MPSHFKRSLTADRGGETSHKNEDIVYTAVEALQLRLLALQLRLFALQLQKFLFQMLTRMEVL